jgi:hypothetical protein
MLCKVGYSASALRRYTVTRKPPVKIRQIVLHSIICSYIGPGSWKIDLKPHSDVRVQDEEVMVFELQYAPFSLTYLI